MVKPTMQQTITSALPRLSAVHALVQLLCSTTSESGAASLQKLEGKVEVDAGAVGQRRRRPRQRRERRHRETFTPKVWQGRR